MLPDAQNAVREVNSPVYTKAVPSSNGKNSIAASSDHGSTSKLTENGCSTKTQKRGRPVSPSDHYWEEADNDLNDVLAMCGIDLADEQRTLMEPAAEILSRPTRSLRNVDNFLNIDALTAKVRSISQKYDSQDVDFEVLHLISKATRQRLEDLVTKWVKRNKDLQKEQDDDKAK